MKLFLLNEKMKTCSISCYMSHKLSSKLTFDPTKQRADFKICLNCKVWNQNQLLVARTSVHPCYYLRRNKVQAAWETPWQSVHSTTLSEKTQREINNVPSPHVCPVLCPAEAWLLIQLRNSDLSALLVLCKDIIQALLRFLNLSLLCFTDAHLRLDNSQYWTAVCRAFCEVRKWIWNVTNHCFSHYMHLQRAKSNLHSAAVVCFNSQLMKADCCLQQKPCLWNVPWASLPCTALCPQKSRDLRGCGSQCSPSEHSILYAWLTNSLKGAFTQKLALFSPPFCQRDECHGSQGQMKVWNITSRSL